MDPQTVPGFLSPEEGYALAESVRSTREIAGVVVEIGAYCGRSTLYLAGALTTGALVFSIDHHRGSEEHQPGGGYDDPRFWDADAGCVDTLPSFRANVRASGLEDRVAAVVGEAAAIGRVWASPVRFLFLDGGHSRRAALQDWRVWSRHMALGGVVAIHDVFARPAEGGRPPHDVFTLACGSGLFAPTHRVGSCQFLTRLGASG